MIHNFEVDCPPEGLPLWVAMNRWPGTECCPAMDNGPDEWIGTRGRIVAMPGEIHDVRMAAYSEITNGWEETGHVIRIHFREPYEDEDLTDFKWTPVPEKVTIDR